MFDSGITAKDLIEQIKSEADVAPDITDETYIRWLNSTEQLLYSELIREQHTATFDYMNGAMRIYKPEDGLIIAGTGLYCEPPRAEDVVAVYCGDTRLIKTTLEKHYIFPDTYCIYLNSILINTELQSGVKMYYCIRPEMKTADNYAERNVMIPIEFIELIAAKQRGEAYKLSNEDVLAAKWLNDYNILLENFKLWLKSRDTGFPEV